MVAAWLRRGGSSQGEGLLFDADVGVEVGIGRSNAGVAEPESDDRGVHPGLQQRHGAAVSEDMWMDFLAEQGSAFLCGGRGVGADPQSDGVAAEPPSGAGGEQRIAGVSGSFGQPESQQSLHRTGQWDRSLFAALAFAEDAGAAQMWDG